MELVRSMGSVDRDADVSHLCAGKCWPFPTLKKRVLLREEHDTYKVPTNQQSHQIGCWHVRSI